MAECIFIFELAHKAASHHTELAISSAKDVQAWLAAPEAFPAMCFCSMEMRGHWLPLCSRQCEVPIYWWDSGTRICSNQYDVVCQLRKEIPVKPTFQKLNHWPISFNLVIVKSPFLLLRCWSHMSLHATDSVGTTSRAVGWTPYFHQGICMRSCVCVWT